VKVLDRYLMRELLVPILCFTVTLVFLILIADVFDNLPELLDQRTSAFVILKYYVNLIPYAFNETIAWATWLGTVLLLVNFGLHNETIAMKVAGLKIATIVRPILFLGAIVGIIAFLVNDRILPPTFRTASELREIYIEHKKNRLEEKTLRNVTYFAGGSRLYYFRKFYPHKKTVEDVVLLWLDRSERNTRQKMVAEKGAWNDGRWEFENVIEYSMDSQGRILGEPRTFAHKVYSEITMTPQDLLNISSESTFLSYRDLKNSIRKLRANGINVDAEKVDLYYRLSAPWQGLIMMLITVPLLAPTRNRKAIAGSVLLCVILVFVYHVTGAVSLALGKAGKLFPFVSAWAANMIFAIGSLVYLDKGNY